MLTITPLPRSAIAGASSATRKYFGLDVEVVDGVELLLGHLRRRLERVGAGVVDEDVHPAADLDGAPGQLPRRLGVAQVGCHEVGPATAGPDPRHHDLAALRVAAGDQHVGALLGQRGSGCGPDPAGGSRHQRHTAVQGKGGHDRSSR
jgi:hypothetical protein